MLVNPIVLKFLNISVIILFVVYISILTYINPDRSNIVFVTVYNLFSTKNKNMAQVILLIVVIILVLNVLSLVSTEKYMIGPNRLHSSEYKVTDLNPAQGDAHSEPTLFNTLKETFATKNLPLWTPK